MRRVLVLHPGAGETTGSLSFLNHEVELHTLGVEDDPERAAAAIREADGVFDAIGLEGLPAVLELGTSRRTHRDGARLRSLARRTPVVDGSGVRAGLERWAVILASRQQPGIFSRKRVLMVPGLNHTGIADGLARQGATLRFADPLLFFSLPDLPGVGQGWTLDQVAEPTLKRLEGAPFGALSLNGAAPRESVSAGPFRWADVVAGDVGAIRRYAPSDLRRKTIVVERAGPEDIEDLAARGAAILVTLMPGVEDPDEASSAALIEALLAAVRPDPESPLDEDTYLNLLAELDWQPSVRYLQPEEAGIHRFAFVIHPLNLGFIHRHPPFWWTRFLPDGLVEAVAAHVPPMYVGKIRGGESPQTGQRIEGHLISLGATPRQMLRHDEHFTYARLNQAARLAERLGARILGLGAFTSVVGDAGVTVAHEAGIAVTSGNSLTVAATLEAAKQAVRLMGHDDLSRGRAMVVGATGSIGSVCARLLAQAVRDVVLVSIEPEKLIDLKRRIEEETPGARVAIGTRANDLVGDCDLVVTATSAFGQRVLNLGACKPGAVICDVARPTDVGEREAALRPDVLVIESGEVLIPGNLEVGYDIGLPKGTVYACLAETALLAMEGRFESYTLGRELSPAKVKEIYQLFLKHGFRIAGLRSFDRYVDEEEIRRKRETAQRYRDDPEAFARHRRETIAAIESMPPVAKGIPARSGPSLKTLAWAGGALATGAWLAKRLSGR